MWISVLLCFSGALRNTGHKQSKGGLITPSRLETITEGRKGRNISGNPEVRTETRARPGGVLTASLLPQDIASKLLIQRRLTCPEMALPTRLSLLPPPFENHENALQTCPQVSLIEAIQLRVPLPRSVKWQPRLLLQFPIIFFHHFCRSNFISRWNVWQAFPLHFSFFLFCFVYGFFFFVFYLIQHIRVWDWTFKPHCEEWPILVSYCHFCIKGDYQMMADTAALHPIRTVYVRLQ